MTRREKLIFWGVALFLLIAFFPVLPILLWLVGWYLRKIPEKRLPFAAYFNTQQRTFYNWVGDFIKTWYQLPLFLLFSAIAIVLVGWVMMSFKIIPSEVFGFAIPSPYGATIHITDSANVDAAEYTTGRSDEPYCFKNLAPGTYVVAETLPPGFQASTPTVVTTTIGIGGAAQIAFGAFRPQPELNTTRIMPQPVALRPMATGPGLPPQICVLAWNDANVNLVRDPGETLLPEWTPPDWVTPLTLLVATALIFVLANVNGFTMAKMLHWDALFWQAEPAAKTLVGETVYEQMDTEARNKLKRHIIDTMIGINKMRVIVSGGQITTAVAPAGDLSRFGGPGVLMVQEGHAVILERTGKVTRVVGSGVTYLDPFERVSMSVYLPTRALEVHIVDAITCDRMVLKDFELLIFHRVDRGDQSQASGQYRYDPKIILGKIWSPKGHDWERTVQSIAKNAARDVIAEYNFADIVSIAGTARLNLRQEFASRINATTKDFLGIEVVGATIGAIECSDEAKRAMEQKGLSEVERQTLVLRAEGEKEAMARKGEGQALAIRRLEAEKSTIRKELIQQLMEPLRQMTGQPLTDKEVVKEYIEVVERLLERLETTMVRDDLDMIRYVEALQTITAATGPKTFIVGDTKGMSTLDLSSR
ncbi:MAG: SPFH domain-containing protein [Anaerolineae bacterium]